MELRDILNKNYLTELKKLSEKYWNWLHYNYISTTKTSSLDTEKKRLTLIKNMINNKIYWPNEDQKKRMYEGNLREKQVLLCINKYTDPLAIEFKDTFICKELKFSANFDAYNPYEKIVYEIKYTKYANDIKYLTKQYQSQIIAQQLALFLHHKVKYNHQLVACYMTDEKKLIYKVYEFKFDEEKIIELFNNIILFWKEYDAYKEKYNY